MTRFLPLALALSVLASSGAALAQTTPAQLAAQQVTALAPQLVPFAGSLANLQSLAAGLVLGQPVTLIATTPDGITQTVTLAAPPAVSPQVAAQQLERTRQALITRGIATPTPEQIGVALTGGTLPTPLGNVIVPGTLTGSVNPAGMQIQRQVAGLSPVGGSTQNLQNLTTGLTQGTPITLTGTTPAGAPTSLTFQVPGGRMSPLEASQMLQFAGQLLASQGIVNPTPEQTRAALLGGTVATPNGNVALRGVLEGRGTVQTAVSNPGTSFSPTVNTSASPVFGTSFSPTFPTPGLPGSASAGGSDRNGPPSPAAQMQGRR
jgi:hypothetical protein